MKKRISLLQTVFIPAVIFISSCFYSAEKSEGAQSMKSFYDYSFIAMDGKTVSMHKFKGKKILLVNVASKCGFTKQYEGLQKLHETYGHQLVVVGFPANNFGGQEPGSNEDIANFCRTNYGITFLMAQKISVIGDDQHPIYRWLTDKTLNGWNDLAPKWNFYKYLINEKGELIKVFPSTTTPMSEEIIAYIH